MRRFHGATWWGVMGLVVALLWVVSGCNGSSSSGSSTTVSAALSGAQEVPPVTTTSASGSGQAILDSNNTILNASVTAAGLSSTVTSVTLNEGAPGQAGPVMFILFTSGQGLTFPGTVRAQLTSLNLQPQLSTSPIVTFTDAADAIRNGNAYYNVLTTAFPSGEIRGQLNATSFVSTLSGTSVVPSITTSATGTGTVTMNNLNTSIGASVTAQGFSSTVLLVQIVDGAAGTNGPPLFTVFDSTVDGTFSGNWSTTLNSTNLLTQPVGSPITGFPAAISAISAGNTYFLVTTTANPTGEIRGQITPLSLALALK